MKRKIAYDVTIGSKWPDGIRTDYENMTTSDVCFPEGGTPSVIELEFETDDSGKNSMKDADKALDEYMMRNHPGETYHIWYWSWLS